VRDRNTQEATIPIGGEGTDNWAQQEFATSNIGDKRLDKRLRQIAKTFCRKPTANIPQATQGHWSQTKGAYRFFSNMKVTMGKIMLPHKGRTKKRIQNQNVVLSVQDTTEGNLTKHPATEGLGYIGNLDNQGIFFHPTLLVTTTGIPLGLINLTTWTRDATEDEIAWMQRKGKKERKKERKKEEKKGRGSVSKKAY